MALSARSERCWDELPHEILLQILCCELNPGLSYSYPSVPRYRHNIQSIHIITTN